MCNLSIYLCYKYLYISTSTNDIYGIEMVYTTSIREYIVKNEKWCLNKIKNGNIYDDVYVHTAHETKCVKQLCKYKLKMNKNKKSNNRSFSNCLNRSDESCYKNWSFY